MVEDPAGAEVADLVQIDLAVGRLCIALFAVSVAKIARFLLNQPEIDRCFAVIAFPNKIQPADQADLAMTGVPGLNLKIDKCMRLFATNVNKIAKFLFVRLPASRFFAMIVLAKILKAGAKAGAIIEVPAI